MTLSKPSSEQKCVHHWMIDPAQGQTSWGRCRRCGAVSEFRNVWISDLMKRTGVRSGAVAIPDNAPELLSD